MDILQASTQLLQAEKTKEPIAPFTAHHAITADDAYRIQLLTIKEKLSQGDQVKGLKIGLTSKAMQEMLNVYTPDYGFILESMVWDEQQPLPLAPFIQAKVEFELAFVFKKKLTGPNVTMEDIVAAIDYVVPAIEVIDSRIANWEIKFEDTVADNGSSAGAILGKTKTKLAEIEDISAVHMTVTQNGVVIDEATSAAVLGNPLHAVAWLIEAISDYDVAIEPGMFVLSGALSKAVVFEAGDHFEADFGALGSVHVTVEKGSEH